MDFNIFQGFFLEFIKSKILESADDFEDFQQCLEITNKQIVITGRKNSLAVFTQYFDEDDEIQVEFVLSIKNDEIRTDPVSIYPRMEKAFMELNENLKEEADNLRIKTKAS